MCTEAVQWQPDRSWVTCHVGSRSGDVTRAPCAIRWVVERCKRNCSTGSTGCVPTALLTTGSWQASEMAPSRLHACKHARIPIRETAGPNEEEYPPRTLRVFPGRKTTMHGLQNCSISHFQACLGCISAIKSASACLSLRTYVPYKCSPHQSRQHRAAIRNVHLSICISAIFNGELQTREGTVLNAHGRNI